MLLRRSNIKNAFTLVEVLASLLLLAIALAGIVQGQNGSIRTVVRSENMAQAMQLAQSKMTETELSLQTQDFGAFQDKEHGDFGTDEKLKAFKWTRLLQKVDVGCFIPEDKGSQTDQQQSYFSLAKMIFKKAIRKIVVRVEWKEGVKKRQIQLTQLYIRFSDVPTNIHF